MRTLLAALLTVSMLFAPCVKIVGAGDSTAHAAVEAAASDQGEARASGDGVPCTKSCKGHKATTTRPAAAVAPDAVSSLPAWGLPVASLVSPVERFGAAARTRGPPERIAWVTFRDIYAITSRLLN